MRPKNEVALCQHWFTFGKTLDFSGTSSKWNEICKLKKNIYDNLTGKNGNYGGKQSKQKLIWQNLTNHDYRSARAQLARKSSQLADNLSPARLLNSSGGLLWPPFGCPTRFGRRNRYEPSGTNRVCGKFCCPVEALPDWRCHVTERARDAPPSVDRAEGEELSVDVSWFLPATSWFNMLQDFFPFLCFAGFSFIFNLYSHIGNINCKTDK